MLFLIGICFSSLAQIQIIDHTEITTKSEEGSDFSDYTAVPLAEDGLLVSLTHYVKGKKEILIAKYDTAFQNIWEQKHLLKGEDKIIDYNLTDSSIYYLIDKQRYEYEILKINLSNGAMKVITYEKILKATYTEICASKNIILLGGEAENNPVVLHLNIKTGKQQILPSLVQKSTYLANLTIDTENDVILAIVAGKYSSSKYSFFYFYDLDAKLRYNVTIPDNKDYDLQTFRPLITGTDEILVFGTYSSPKWKRSQGIYSLKIKDKKENGFRFYDFSYLNNFFNNLTEKKREKMLAKVKKGRKKGSPVRYSNDYFISPLREEKNRIYFSLEGYNSVYENSTNVANNMIGNPYFGSGSSRIYNNRRGNRSFWQNGGNSTPNPKVSYKYEQGMVCSFDKEGKLLWDNQFDFNEFESQKIFPFFSYSVKNDTLALFRLDEKELFYKQTVKSVEQSLISEYEIPRRDSLDNIINRSDEILMHWYDDNYLVSGYQIVRNTLYNPARRKVFYFTRLRYPFSATEVDKKEDEEE
ncbi:hypothetical protein [Bernardetia litoralis]|uniref:hypothetical protein n=1 Tax=Bernardetia litoralis TaxID=999 RepID=UPI0012FE1934|nr:hypothetical protein [Bernardetia litoralis]